MKEENVYPSFEDFYNFIKKDIYLYNIKKQDINMIYNTFEIKLPNN